MFILCYRHPPFSGGVMTEEKLKINWRIINALRGIAALGVVFNHARGWLFSTDALYAMHVHAKAGWRWWEWGMIESLQMTSLGAEFVIMFFLLSGFSIAHSLSNTTHVAGFYKRRAVRLYPTYIAGLLWAFIAFLIAMALIPDIFYHTTDGQPPIADYYHKYISGSNILQSLVYVYEHDFLTHQYWSLPLEVLFYLLAPWLVKHLRLWGVLSLVAVAVGCYFTGIYFHEEDQVTTLQLFLTDYNIFFLIGVLLYRYKEQLVGMFPVGKWTFYISTIIAFVAFVWVKGHEFHEVSNKVTAIISVVFTCWLMFGAMKHNVEIGWLDKVGNYSYSLYVTHIASIFVVKVVSSRLGYGFYEIDNLYVWLFGVVLSVAIAYLWYLVAERPSIRLLQKMREAK